MLKTIYYANSQKTAPNITYQLSTHKTQLYFMYSIFIQFKNQLSISLHKHTLIAIAQITLVNIGLRPCLVQDKEGGAYPCPIIYETRINRQCVGIKYKPQLADHRIQCVFSSGSGVSILIQFIMKAKVVWVEFIFKHSLK